MNRANKAVEKTFQLENDVLLKSKREFVLPANKYMMPVTNIALICRWNTPKAPKSAALPKIIKHTNEQDIDKFCIPKIKIQTV